MGIAITHNKKITAIAAYPIGGTCISPQIEEENKCCIFGKKESQDTKSDLLRECFLMSQNGDWDKGLMQPRLNFIEIAYIRRGPNYLCHNRSKCRERQEKNNSDKRKNNTK